MTWQGLALGAAGLAGCLVAVAHGLPVERRAVAVLLAPDGAVAGPPPRTRRLLRALVHAAGVAGLPGGLALVAASAWPPLDAALPVDALAGGLLLCGAVLNLWAVYGLHAGWVDMGLAVALTLIVLWSGANRCGSRRHRCGRRIEPTARRKGTPDDRPHLEMPPRAWARGR